MTSAPDHDYYTLDPAGLAPGDVWVLERPLSRSFYVRTFLAPGIREVLYVFKDGWWEAPGWVRRGWGTA